MFLNILEQKTNTEARLTLTTRLLMLASLSDQEHHEVDTEARVGPEATTSILVAKTPDQRARITEMYSLKA